jgi:hypothetical protein
MSLGLFDIVGPVMRDLPVHLTFSFHPIFMKFFQGQRV